MKRITLGILLISLLVSPLVRAEGSLSDAQIQVIQTNCQAEQVALQHVQESDRLTYINRRHYYDSLLKLMTNFNGRVVQNKLNAPDLISIVSDYQKVLDTSRDEYTTYDNALSEAARMDCRNEPTTFNDRLVSLRGQRSSLSTRMQQSADLLDKYQKGVNNLRAQQGIAQ